MSDLGYEKVQIEMEIPDLLTCVDIYIPSINTVIEINGPSHYFEGTQMEFPNLTQKLKQRHFNVISIDGRTNVFQDLLSNGSFDCLNEASLEEPREWIKTLINKSL